MEIVESTFRNLHNRAKVFDKNLDTVIAKQKRIESDFYSAIDLVREIREKARLLNDKLQRIEKGVNMELYMKRPILKNVYKKSTNIPEIRISDDDDDYDDDNYNFVDENKTISSRIVMISPENDANLVNSSKSKDGYGNYSDDDNGKQNNEIAARNDDYEKINKPVLNGYDSDDDYDPVEEKRLRDEAREKREEKLRQEEEEEDRLWEEEKMLRIEKKANDDELVGDKGGNDGDQIEQADQKKEEEEKTLIDLSKENELQNGNEISSENIIISMDSCSKEDVVELENELKFENISISANSLSEEEERLKEDALSRANENGLSDDLSEDEENLKQIALARANELDEDEEEERRILEKIEKMKQEELLLMQQEEQ